uniref:Pituitary tumor-transforming gene 1 protein-interacting protein-like n=1 Tax=Paramormyrops kingsleyae TaxID=1676925 RepID=A0A3B3S9C5_9TELE|nr:pituitary tumor-transforming gene 1 protein-interacting protein-like [Paramormyrops kingsleyae]XP_023695879.1 pituitary tumor-transforming gene 1 protein-interacting protein-like [Paramormyrops kingsleyae]
MVELRIFVPFAIMIFSMVISQTSAKSCEMSNSTCEDCLRNVSCLWCRTTMTCVVYPVRSVLPPSSLCPLAQARWGRCWVNFQALIITLSVFGGIILIGIFVCCCCCYYRCKKSRTMEPDPKEQQEEERRKARHEERKAEMKMRHDEIRMKYGLTKENPYARFEDN